MTRYLIVVMTLLLSAVAASDATAQQPATPPAPGTMTVERVEEGFAWAPDVRVTEVNDRTATLIGGYAGWMTDRTWLIGGGGYWLANQDDDLEMAYGGLVVEWLGRGTDRIGFGMRGLVGGGSATIGSTIGDYFGAPPPGSLQHTRPRNIRDWGHGGHSWLTVDPDTPLLVHEYFFVAEPQASFILHFTRWARLDLGVGYRFTAGAGPIDDELSGVSASIAVQFGGGSRKQP